LPKREQWKPFSKDEAEKIREALTAPFESLSCPACGNDLTLAPPPDGQSSTAFWEIRCKHCGRGQILQDLL
jgi:ribosomal protein S27E